MYTGPKLHNDQLVFGYDTGYGLDQHSSTRHYKGEPATNLITAGLPGYFGSGGETLYRSNYYGLNSDSGVFQRNFVSNPALTDSSTYNNNAGLYKNFTTAALSSNTEYVLVSFDFYMITPYVRHSNSGTGLNGYMRIEYTDGTASSIGWNTSLNTPNAGDDWNNNSNYIGQWRKIALYVQVNSSKTPSAITHVYIYNDRTITGEGIFTNFIITEHVTPPTGPVNYTSGTRSSTQSIIDLKRTINIDVSNVSFDRTGQPTFDGTSDYIGKTRRQYTTEAWSVETIFKPTDATDTSWNGLFGGHLGAGGYWFFHSAGNLALYSSAGYITYRTWTKANTFTVDEFHHLVITYTPATTTTGTFNMYYNGGEKTESFSFTFSNIYTLDSQFIGMGAGNRYGTNDVAVYKEYEKVLSADEVKQNYKAYKNRFNI
tara:strand:+ start:1227 stop:2510 length:1284 start_codon:yes stop_codon:yes gene_type:complete